ncbi:high affinity immunoglobulin epsilon receptor subunit gamma [Boleophthalmus pectinirostris]|uniref:high affinity immunoglobulin epsilon receptor subunit gamma n=1 Tax=Boleophthalmus pectinirostris TaxID=150288 RepID=UPI000A1C680F|nr:high affinity immunoglobulin epsilon receptor subunit gamma [Boleophthalmus pectinirostris]
MGRPGPLALVLPLWMCFGRAAAGLHEPQICYVLDGILFLYGLVLTTLYCRLKIISCKKGTAAKPKGTEEGIYSGLTQPADTYETIGMKT